MREEHIQGDLQIKPPSGSAFGCETPPAMPKLHQACLVVGPRGSGKSTATVNLIERLPFDRIFVISPSMKSNKELMDRLKIDPEDVVRMVADGCGRVRTSVDGWTGGRVVDGWTGCGRVRTGGRVWTGEHVMDGRG